MRTEQSNHLLLAGRKLVILVIQYPRNSYEGSQYISFGVISHVKSADERIGRRYDLGFRNSLYFQPCGTNLVPD